jgi:hypothetical protein
MRHDAAAGIGVTDNQNPAGSFLLIHKNY